jgi:hypothetical protein
MLAVVSCGAAALAAGPSSAPTAPAQPPTVDEDVKTLTAVVELKDQSTKVKPIMDRLAQVVDSSKNDQDVKAAQQIAARMADFGKKQLARTNAMEAGSPRMAQAAYKQLAAQFEGMEIGGTAAQRLKEKDFLEALRAWEGYERMLNTEKSLKDVPGARHSIKDAKYAEVNRLTLETMRGQGHTLAQMYPKTSAATAARRLMAKYEL